MRERERRTGRRIKNCGNAGARLSICGVSSVVPPNNFLLLDASSPRGVIAGRFDASGRAWAAFAEEKSAALEGVFAALAKLDACGLGGAFSGFLFCEGPGSILGIRIAAAAIRARLAADSGVPANSGVPAVRCLAFQSLSLAAALILRAFPRERDFTVAAESRLNSCNVLRVSGGVPEAHFREIPAAEAERLPAAEKIFVLPSRRALPGALAARAEPIFPAELLARDAAVFADVPALLRDCGNAPDAVNTAAASSYVHWTPTRHSKDSVPAKNASA